MFVLLIKLYTPVVLLSFTSNPVSSFTSLQAEWKMSSPYSIRPLGKFHFSMAVGLFSFIIKTLSSLNTDILTTKTIPF